MLASNHAVIAILGMGAVTYLTRIAGLSVGRFIPPESPAGKLLELLPGCILVAILAPAVVHGGVVDWIAAAATLFVAMRFSNLFASLAVGIGTVIILRALFGL